MGDSSFWSQISYLQLNAKILKDLLPNVESIKKEAFDVVVIGESIYEYELAQILHLPYV